MTAEFSRGVEIPSRGRRLGAGVPTVCELPGNPGEATPERETPPPPGGDGGAREAKGRYRLRLSASWMISSVVVMIRLFAW